MIKSEMLVESKSLRETVIERVDVLDKVKKLSTLPGDIYVTIDMTANYYEVDRQVIAKIVTRNREELETDGMRVIKGKELSDIVSLSKIGKKTVALTVLPRRAVLRIGMLLQESEVAKAVRSYLLDKEEEKEAPQQSDFSGLSPTLQVLISLEQRQNAYEAKQNELTKGFEQIKETVTSIQEIIVDRDENWRRSINSMFNAAVYRMNTKHDELRNKSYEILEERAHCNLKTRLNNWHKRLDEKGWSKSRISNVTRMDVIEQDQKLKEIYTAIVKEFSIKSLKLVNH